MSPAALGWARAGIVMGLVVAVDQVTKALVVSSLELGESERFFLGVDLTYVRNRGVAFGVLGEGGAPIVALTAVALTLLVGYFALHAARPMLWLPVGLLLGGAVGNLADRSREGAVIDFVDPVAWPAFNLADSAVVIGVLGFLYVLEGRRE